MRDCLFCKIIKGEIKEEPLWENKEYIAYLDRNPNTKGVIMVMPKKHFDSYVFDMPDEAISSYMSAAKMVAKILEKAFKVHRVAMVMEGLGINHAHIKLYPIHGLEDKFVQLWSKERVFFDKYPGYITTQLGPELSREKLIKMTKEINFKN